MDSIRDVRKGHTKFKTSSNYSLEYLKWLRTTVLRCEDAVEVGVGGAVRVSQSVSSSC